MYRSLRRDLLTTSVVSTHGMRERLRVALDAWVPEDLKAGPFTLDRAREVGLTKRQLRSKAWRRLGPEVYAWVGLRDSPSLKLAAVALRLPAGTPFCGRTAAWLHNIESLFAEPIEVTVPPTCRSAAGLRVTRATSDRTKS